MGDMKVFRLKELLRETFQVLYFASAKEAAGVASDVISLEENTTELDIPALFEKLETMHPKLKQKRIFLSVAVAINHEYVEVEDGKIHAGDEVAIIPPVSGG